MQYADEGWDKPEILVDCFRFKRSSIITCELSSEMLEVKIHEIERGKRISKVSFTTSDGLHTYVQCTCIYRNNVKTMNVKWE